VETVEEPQMKRRCSALAALALVVLLAGCAMCQSPFDYCSPVEGPHGRNCNFNARRGSIFERMDDSADTQLAPTLAPEMAESDDYAADEEGEPVDYEESIESER
jgi:hypothetical protein